MAALSAARVTVTHVATALCGDLRESVLIKNIGAVTVDIGTSGTTYGAGFPLGVNESVTLEFRDEPEVIYGITSAEGVTCVVAVLKVAIP